MLFSCSECVKSTAQFLRQAEVMHLEQRVTEFANGSSSVVNEVDQQVSLTGGPVALHVERELASPLLIHDAQQPEHAVVPPIEGFQSPGWP